MKRGGCICRIGLARTILVRTGYREIRSSLAFRDGRVDGAGAGVRVYVKISLSLSFPLSLIFSNSADFEAAALFNCTVIEGRRAFTSSYVQFDEAIQMV
jgi:hypothetical protein